MKLKGALVEESQAATRMHWWCRQMAVSSPFHQQLIAGILDCHLCDGPIVQNCTLTEVRGCCSGCLHDCNSNGVVFFVRLICVGRD